MRTIHAFSRVAAALVFAAAIACSDSLTPAQLDPEEMESIGYTVAGELQTSMASLTAPSAMSGGTFHRIPATGPEGLSLSRASAQLASTECGVPSQDPVVDTDLDGIPDDLTVTYSLPACRYTSVGTTMDITGALRVRDPSPSTPAFSFTLSLKDLQVAFSSEQGSATVVRNGTGAVDVSGSGLGQSLDFSTKVSATGVSSATYTTKWSSTFFPAAGEAIAAGEPLPNGAYAVSGTNALVQGSRYIRFTLTTPVPLQYDKACAEWSMTPFQSGEVHVTFAGNEGKGFVMLRYTGCADPEIVFVAS